MTKTARLDFNKNVPFHKKKALFKALVEYDIHDGNKVKDATWHLKFSSEQARTFICAIMQSRANDIFTITYTN